MKPAEFLCLRLRPFLNIRYSLTLSLGICAGFLYGQTVSAQTASFSGAQTTVASSGLTSPMGVAVDGNGNVYIADTSNNRILKETPAGGAFSQSVAVSGLLGPHGVAVDGNGNLYIADTQNNRVLVETLSGGSYTQNIVAASLNGPTGVAVDGSGNVYIADAQNNRVLKETLSAGAYSQSTIGSGLSGPTGIAVDGSGNVYISDSLNGRVLKETLSSGAYTQTAIVSGLSNATGVAVDANANVYIADPQNKRVLKETWSNFSYSQSMVASSGLNSPWGLALDAAGDVYIGDTSSNRVLEEFVSTVNFGTIHVGSSSSVISLIFNFTTAGSISAPGVLTQGVSGMDFVDAGTGSCTLNETSYSAGANCTVDVVFTPRAPGSRQGAAVLSNGTGTRIVTAYLVGTGSGPQVNYLPGTQATYSFNYPSGSSGTASGIAVDAAGNLYIAETYYLGTAGNGVVKETWTGSGYTQTTVATGLSYPVGIAVDGAGNVFIADQDNYAIVEETPTSSGYTQSMPIKNLAVEGVAVDGSGNLYIQDENAGLVKATLSAGTYTLSTVPTGELNVSYVFADAAGDIYFVPESNPYTFVKETPSNGGYTKSTFSMSNSAEELVAIDNNGGVYEYVSGTLYKAVPSGGTYVVSTSVDSIFISGTGAVDSSGNLYVANSPYQGNSPPQSITRVDYADSPSLIFPVTSVGSSSGAQTVTMENTGNAALTFPLPSTGTNPGITTNFSWNSSGGSACPLLTTSASAPGTLPAGSSCLLPISYAPTTSSPSSGFLTLTDNALNATAPGYATQQISLGVTGSPATPAISWPAPGSVSYGTSLSAAQLNATSSVPGAFAYTPAAGTVLGVGTQTLSVTFTPTNTAQYSSATATTTLVVNQAIPAISWSAPAAITYGTALGSTQLNASSTVAGTFTYTPASGVILGAGSHTLSVTFTPTDSTDYLAATTTVTLVVNQAVPPTTWTTPAAISYGTALSATQLNATSTVAGTFTYLPVAGTVLTAGSHTLSATFTPTDTTDYTTATASTSISVSQITPIITWTPPAGITYGTALNSTQLNATANVPGRFIYTPSAGSIPHAGTDTLSVTFVPTDTVDYTNATGSVTLAVTQATPTITWATPTAISYGTALGSGQLDATANVAGTWIYSPAAGTVSPTGNNTLSVTFTPTDAVDYTAATKSVTLTVNQATPTITWATPATIVYGTALSSAQLNATAPVQGTFSYTPALGTVLGAGSQTLSVTFTPSDTTDYHTATNSVSLTVNKAALTIAANNTVRVFGAANPAFTGTVSGAVNGDTFTESFSTAATASSLVGSYAIVPAITGTNSANYNITATNGVLTVSQAGTSTTFVLTNNNLTLTATVASLTSGIPTGTVGFYEGQTLIGTGTLANGVASYTASTFPSGDVVVSAEYSGDADFTQSAAPPILFLSVAPATTSLSVAASGSVSDVLTVAVAPGYAGTVQFTCSGLPAGATCTFSPSSITFTGGSSTATTTLAIQTGTVASMSPSPSPFQNSRAPALAAMLGMPGLLALMFTRGRRKLSARLQALAILLALCGMSSALIACGGTSNSSQTGSSPTPAGTSTVQVLATGPSNLTQTTSLTLNVQ